MEYRRDEKPIQNLKDIAHKQVFSLSLEQKLSSLVIQFYEQPKREAVIRGFN